ncbi:MAG: cell wall-binding repeat-containing protein, partial [Actinomycetota bacterium]|nr:cell wall-binding repeat-containing protein [Actinomycetota bacterium]
VAEEVRRRWPGTPTVALARAHGTATDPSAAWADSVTGGAWAARQRVPIVVTDRDALHPAVADALRRWQPTRTVLLGGVAALSDAVQAAVPAPQRVAGPSRVETAVAIATQLWGSASPRRYVVMHGFRPDGWAYGLSAAGLAADTAAPVLLVDGSPEVHPAVRPLVGACGQPVVDLIVVGGTSVLGESTVAALDAADGNAC